MGFSADQSMVLISKAQMDALEGRRADINLEKMALMREQETLALAYNDAMSNTCFVAKNPDGEYEAIGPEISGGVANGSLWSPDGQANGISIDFSGMTSKEKAEAKKRYAEQDGELRFAQDLKNGVIGLKKNGSSTTLQETNGITESYYTEDDDAAKADYDAAMAKIRTKETKLDMDLEQVETQYQAIKTQYESARQLVNQRAQGDFKFFQG